MPIIQLSTIIRNNKRQAVYNLLKDMQRFPIFMRDVKDIDIIEKKGNKLITFWRVSIDGADIFWKEEDIFNDKQMNLKFRMIEGDYSKYEGEWSLEDISEDTRIILYANFDWGVPAFEKLVGDILKKKARDALRSMLNAIKKELERDNG
jgi:ribosome-associated toxin RatA of RatAB toxin-antitoxin module